MPPNGLSFAEQISSAFTAQLESKATLQTFKAPHVLFNDGDKADFVYLICSGSLKLMKTTMDGKELTLQVCGPGELVGVVGIFEKNLVYNSTVIVMDVCEVAIVPRATLENLLLCNSEFCIEFMRWMGRVHRRTQSKFRDLLLNGKTGALYSTLIRMSNSYGVPQEDGSILIDLSLTNRDLAQYIGLTRESVNRMLAELRKLDVIDILPLGHILIKDIHYLKTAIHCDDCPPDICQI
ncbi:Crp/Fnr family transcriptional regulator [Brevibacillus ginsengisoli]|uniref:Crp/Fnr family transcriptional regulator n=1 Tax=Brevibacillus ginsengisoli TaxID=363854 RepID=UPI003CF56666